MTPPCELTTEFGTCGPTWIRGTKLSVPGDGAFADCDQAEQESSRTMRAMCIFDIL